MNGKPKFLGRSTVGLVEFYCQHRQRDLADGRRRFRRRWSALLQALEQSILAPGGIDAAGAFWMKTEFDIETFETYMLFVEYSLQVTRRVRCTSGVRRRVCGVRAKTAYRVRCTIRTPYPAYTDCRPGH